MEMMDDQGEMEDDVKVNYGDPTGLMNEEDAEVNAPDPLAAAGLEDSDVEDEV